VKKLILPLLFVLVIASCKENEVPTVMQKRPTIIKGRCTIVNTDIPAPNVDIYIYTGGFPTPQILIDETVSDSNGNYTLTYNGDHLYAKMGVNQSRTGFIAGRQKFGEENALVFEKDGKTHIQDFEMIPPAWVNVILRNKNKRNDYDIGYISTQRDQENWLKFDKNQTIDTIMMKVLGNMPDSISLLLRKYVGQEEITVERKVHMITVPGFMVKDTIIDF
jgi:hypothetical protein